MSLYSESLRAFLKPVLSFLDDDQVTEILINGPEEVWIEKRGKLLRTEARFTEEGLLGAARNMAQFVGRPLTEERPRLDARLPDGSRIHVVLAPIARNGTTLSIRKFFREKPTMHSLLRYGSLTAPMARLIEAAVHLKLNVMVSGGTGSGKTTLLNVISALIPDNERILTIEDSAELQLAKSHLVSLESRPADKYGKGAVDMGELVHTALRLRPDRIVVGEVRGGEAFHLMQALNTGHGGSLSTVHANTPPDTLRRLESLCLMNAVEMPLVAVRAAVASAIHLIVCCERLFDGSRKVTSISQVLPLNEKGEYRTQELFVFTPVGKDEAGNVVGYHAPTGVLPTFLSRARAYGFADLQDDFFDPATYDLPPPPQVTLGEDVTIRWAPSLRHRERGEADPETFRAQWSEFENRLKHDAARALAQPASRSALATKPRPQPARPPPPPPVGDDEPTPSPPREPIGNDDTDPRAKLPFQQEPSVEVAPELISDARAHNTAVRSYPPQPVNRIPTPPARPSPKPAREGEETPDVSKGRFRK